MNFYVYKNEQNLGPLTEDAVSKGLRSGQFLPNDLGCRVGETEWRDLSFFFPLAPPALPSQAVTYYPPPAETQHRPQLASNYPVAVPYKAPPPSYNSGASDVGRMMYYQANQKSASTAYLLWFFLGGLSAHRFYMGKTGSAIGQALLWWCSLLLCYVLIGFLIVWIPILWIFIDLFLISGWVREHNNKLIADVGTFR